MNNLQHLTAPTCAPPRHCFNAFSTVSKLLAALFLAGVIPYTHAQSHTSYNTYGNVRTARAFSQRVTFSDNRLLYDFLDDFTQAVELHDWDRLLTYFYEDTYLIQTQEFELSDAEFIITAMGLYGSDVSLLSSEPLDNTENNTQNDVFDMDTVGDTDIDVQWFGPKRQEGPQEDMIVLVEDTTAKRNASGYRMLNQIDVITLSERINSGIGAAEIRGTVTLLDGRQLDITLFLRKAPTGRYEVVSPVG